MQKNNRSLSKSAVLLVAILAFLNASCSSKVSTRNNLVIPPAVARSNDNIQPLRIEVIPTQSLEEQRRMSVEDADYTLIRILLAKLSLKSERVQ